MKTVSNMDSRYVPTQSECWLH